MKNNKGRAISPGYAAVYLILILWSLTTIFPLAWSVMNSFKDKKYSEDDMNKVFDNEENILNFYIA